MAETQPKSINQRAADVAKELRSRSVWEAKKHLQEVAKQRLAQTQSKCEMCGKEIHFTKRPKLVVHHRHYRTVTEEGLDDIVILCRDCHADLHERHKQDKLTMDDLPFVDPEWEMFLENGWRPYEEGRSRLKRAIWQEILREYWREQRYRDQVDHLEQLTEEREYLTSTILVSELDMKRTSTYICLDFLVEQGGWRYATLEEKRSLIPREGSGSYPKTIVRTTD